MSFSKMNLKRLTKLNCPNITMITTANHTNAVRVIHHRHGFFLILFLFTFYCHSLIEPRIFNIYLLPNVQINRPTCLLLFLYVPGRILGWLSAFCALLPLRMHQLSRKESKRRFSRLLLCYVTKGHNREVQRHHYRPYLNC